MSCLLRNTPLAVLDLINRADIILFLANDHVKFARRKTVLENLVILSERFRRFQQDNILQHSPPDFLQNPFRDRIPFLKRQLTKGFILHQRPYQRPCLTVPHSRLCKDHTFLDSDPRFCILNGALHNQIQRLQVLLNLCRMLRQNLHRLLLPVPDFQQLHHPFGDRFSVDVIQNIRSLLRIPIFP